MALLFITYVLPTDAFGANNNLQVMDTYQQQLYDMQKQKEALRQQRLQERMLYGRPQGLLAEMEQKKAMRAAPQGGEWGPVQYPAPRPARSDIGGWEKPQYPPPHPGKVAGGWDAPTYPPPPPKPSAGGWGPRQYPAPPPKPVPSVKPVPSNKPVGAPWEWEKPQYPRQNPTALR